MTCARIALASCAVLGCVSSTTPLPSNQDQTAEPTADRAFLDSLVPDYESPAHHRAHAARKRAAERYTRACREGEPDACWWANALLPDPDLAARIAASCSAGHAMSCRAKQLQPGLSPTQLHEGCAAGLDDECIELAQTSPSIEETRFAWERSCAITRTTCHRAAEAFLDGEPRDPIKARDLLELGCSFDRAADCLALAAAYLRGELVEPVRERGRLLYDYACGLESATSRRRRVQQRHQHAVGSPEDRHLTGRY